MPLHIFTYGEYEASHQGQIQGSGEGGGGGDEGDIHSTVPETKSSLRQIANFINCPGDYRHKSGDREIRFKIRRLPDYPGELPALPWSEDAVMIPCISCHIQSDLQSQEIIIFNHNPVC